MTTAYPYLACLSTSAPAHPPSSPVGQLPPNLEVRVTAPWGPFPGCSSDLPTLATCPSTLTRTPSGLYLQHTLASHISTAIPFCTDSRYKIPLKELLPVSLCRGHPGLLGLTPLHPHYPQSPSLDPGRQALPSDLPWAPLDLGCQG